MENTATINGLLDGISVLETKNNVQPAYTTDILYNNEEPINLELQNLYYDEGYTVSEYRVEDFGQPITLLSTITMEEAILGTKEDSTDEYGFKYNH
jgi:hypothetical protein